MNFSIDATVNYRGHNGVFDIPLIEWGQIGSEIYFFVVYAKFFPDAFSVRLDGIWGQA